MKGRWPTLLAGWLLAASVQAADDVPSPDLLELLGQFSALEQLGVDVDQQIEQRKAAQQSSQAQQQQLRDQQVLPESGLKP